jgi:hypothetical protein
MSTRDHLVTAALVLTGAAAIWSGMHMVAGAQLFPTVIGVVLVLVALAHSFVIGRGLVTEQEPDSISWGRCAAALGLAVAFVFLIEPLGMYVAMPLYLFLAIRLLSRAGTITAALVGLGFTAMTFVTFHTLLEVPTPPGLLGVFFDL